MPTGVLILAGATASGKTDLAITLARRFDAEIVSADSRQIYRGMPVGTAAPNSGQLAAVPHHLVQFLDPHERYSAARFAEDAMAAIAAIHARGKRAIVAGGTGFYLRALTGGVELAAAYDQALRERLAREARLHGSEFLYEWLASRDPQRAAVLYPQDSYRIVRALEVALSQTPLRKKPIPSLAASGIAFLYSVLDVERSALDERIEARVDAMLAAGLLDEAERIGEGAVAASAVGYPQSLAYLRGWSTMRELRESLLRATRRYARRQLSWFRGERHACSIRPELIEAAAREKLGWV